MALWRSDGLAETRASLLLRCDREREYRCIFRIIEPMPDFGVWNERLKLNLADINRISRWLVACYWKSVLARPKDSPLEISVLRVLSPARAYDLR
jgi:hypothetical protein